MKKETKTTAKTTAKKSEPVAKTAAEKTTVEAKAVDKKVPAAEKKADTKIKKAAPKKTAAKKTTKKAEVKETVYLQFYGKEIATEAIVKQVRGLWTKQYNNKVADLKTVDIYLKPEEHAAYYVMNDEITGKLSI